MVVALYYLLATSLSLSLSFSTYLDSKTTGRVEQRRYTSFIGSYMHKIYINYFLLLLLLWVQNNLIFEKRTCFVDPPYIRRDKTRQYDVACSSPNNYRTIVQDTVEMALLPNDSDCGILWKQYNIYY